VQPLHAAPLAGKLRDAGLTVAELSFPAGEASKVRDTKARLEDRLPLGAGRDSVLVAVGGGVTGDLAGFVAATWYRGVPVVQVPTSLLAMADAALGGKTAVNLAGGKNLVGAFHQPWGLYADVSVLETLPEQTFVEGFAEIVKTAAIADAELFAWLESSVEPLRARRADALEHALAACLRIKGRIVRRDEREAGRRAALNFGHTVAHALETAGDLQQTHGRAVAIGMCAEARLAHDATGLTMRQVARLETLIRRFGLPTRLPAAVDVEALIEATRRDKKNRAGATRYALPRTLGRMPPGDQVTVEIAPDRLRRVLGELT